MPPEYKFPEGICLYFLYYIPSTSDNIIVTQKLCIELLEKKRMRCDSKTVL